MLSEENKIPIESKQVDYCLLSSVVHELENKVLFLRELKRILKDKGRIGVIDWKKVPSPLGPPLKERISVLTMKHIVSENGFKIEKTINLGKYNYAIVAVKT
jgi:ubiquinone/menaquinone biosynthesis C-methylase UbiE